MNPLAQMNQAMSYLEENLTEDIRFVRMAHIAGCSEYHFRRMFSYLAGMPLGEYIRCRKLALAGSCCGRAKRRLIVPYCWAMTPQTHFAKPFKGCMVSLRRKPSGRTPF